MAIKLGSFEQTIVSAEEQVGGGKELTKKQKKELRSVSLSLVINNSKEALALRDRISRCRDASSRICNVNFVNGLEKRYGEIDAEYRNPDTTPERREELLKEQREISETLRMLQR